MASLRKYYKESPNIKFPSHTFGLLFPFLLFLISPVRININSWALVTALHVHRNTLIHVISAHDNSLPSDKTQSKLSCPNKNADSDQNVMYFELFFFCSVSIHSCTDNVQCMCLQLSSDQLQSASFFVALLPPSASSQLPPHACVVPPSLQDCCREKWTGLKIFKKNHYGTKHS